MGAQRYRRARKDTGFEDVRPANGGRVGKLRHERDRAPQRRLRVAPIDAALEAMARLGVQAVASRRATHAARIEVRALEKDAFGRRSDLAVTTPHDAGERYRPLAVADDQVVGSQCSLDAVERHQYFPRTRMSDDDASAAHSVEVE